MRIHTAKNYLRSKKCLFVYVLFTACYAIQMTYTILVGDIAKIYIGTSTAGGQGKGNETD